MDHRILSSTVYKFVWIPMRRTIAAKGAIITILKENNNVTILISENNAPLVLFEEEKRAF